jgi:hypothetical protein
MTQKASKVNGPSASKAEDKNELLAWYQKYMAYIEVLPHFPLVDSGHALEMLPKLMSDFYKSKQR